MVFISLLDDRATPKSSRDPLGFELIWTHFGRKVIGNLTTITTSMDNFAVALLGFYLANDLVPKTENERHRKIREQFLRYEQLAGYLRYHEEANNIMGITRVKQRLATAKSSSEPNLKLGLSADQMILSDQASYGLWGLYSSASRDSGLVKGDNRVVSNRGMNIVNSIQDHLGDCVDQFRKWINLDDDLNYEKLEPMGERFRKAIQHHSVRKELLEILLAGNDPNGIQNELWQKTQNIFQGNVEPPQDVGQFIHLILKNGPTFGLQQSLEDIQRVERLLVACNNLFHYCRRKDGEELTRIIESIRDEYSYLHLPNSLPEDQFPRKILMTSILEAFRNNKLRRVIEELINLNKEVMQSRNGAPWVEIEPGGTLRVKIKSEKAQLANQRQLETRWDYDYFIGSYLRIARNHLGNV